MRSKRFAVLLVIVAYLVTLMLTSPAPAPVAPARPA